MSDDLPIIGGRWKLERTLGAGAMGEVWAAHHVVTGQPAAVKILHSHVGHDPRSVQRFTREVQAAATIDHPGVAAVYDGGRDANGALYIAMELLEGESLGDWLRHRSPDLTQVVRVFLRLLDALHASHAVGIIHRDIKPDNIFVLDGPADDRPVKLLDFGIARYEEGKQGATQTGLTVGTPFYMSPEQAMDPRTCGPQADIWSLGVILYEVLAGQPPFSGETSTAVCLAAIQHPHGDLRPIAPNTPARLLDAIDRCLEKQPGDRFASAEALKAELILVLAELMDRSGQLPIARLAPRAQMDGADAASTKTGSELAAGRRRTLLIVLLIGLISAGLTWWLLGDKSDPSANAPMTNTPASMAPATVAPTSMAPATVAPATVAPATVAPVTAAPVTQAAPETAAPRTAAPRTARPKAPRTRAPRTSRPKAPRTRAPRTAPKAPATRAPQTAAPATAAPATAAPATAAPATAAPATAAPATAAPRTAAPVTAAPRTAAPASKAPPSKAPASKAPKTEPFFSF